MVSPGFVDGIRTWTPKFLGSTGSVFVLSRRYQCGDGQLWLHPAHPASKKMRTWCFVIWSVLKTCLGRHARRHRLDWKLPAVPDAVDALPRALTTQATSATRQLRTYVMGERAFSETAPEDDTRRMQAVVQEAMHAGCRGFSTSRTFNHITADDSAVWPVAWLNGTRFALS